MATMTWNILTSASTTPGSISNWLSKASITSGADGVADFIILEAESWIYRRLRHWRMLTGPTSVTLTQGVATITFPTGFLEPMNLWYLYQNAPYWMTQVTPTQVYQSWNYNSNGVRVQQPPTIYSFEMSEIQMDSPPDQTYSGFITYYQQLEGLSGTNPTNFLTQYYPRLIRCACMAAACEWAKDNGQGNFDRTYWDQLAQDEIDKAQAESGRARRGEINAGVLIGGNAPAWPAYLPGTWG